MDSQEVVSPLVSPHLACLHAAKHTHWWREEYRREGHSQPSLSVYYALIGLFQVLVSSNWLKSQHTTSPRELSSTFRTIKCYIPSTCFVLKRIVQSKMFCHLFTVNLIQPCMSFCLLLNTKEEVF